MAKPGPRPKPTAIKRLSGNPGKRPLNKNEPQYDLESVRVPRGKLNDDGKKLWHQVASRLADAGLLTEVDKPALMMMCFHYQVIVEASRVVDEEGLISVGSKGQPVAHPAVGILNNASTAFRRWATEFGLTPSSRTSLEIEPGQDVPTLAEQLTQIAEGSAESG